MGSGKGSMRKKWAKRLGTATFAAGILASQQTAVANPTIADLLNRAMTRAAATSSRREDVQMPVALVLEPAGQGSKILFAGHRSHSSHRSHRSHTSHLSGTSSRTADTQPSTKNTISPGDKASPTKNTRVESQGSQDLVVTTRSGDKIVTLKDGSRLVGRPTANKKQVAVICKYLSLEVKKRDVVSTLAAPRHMDLVKLSNGRCIIKFSNGKELRTNAEERDKTIVLLDGNNKRTVPKSRVSKLIHLGKPTQDWNKTEDAYCVVTLRDGSVLRGKICKQQDKDQYLLKNRFGDMRLAKESVFCFQKVEKVFSNDKTRTKGAPKPGKTNEVKADTRKGK
jgi:hypothetical protein